MLLQKNSQILAVTEISTSQEDKILTIVKNIPKIQELIDNQKFHELHLEAPPDHPRQFIEDIGQPWTTSDGKQTVELETKEFPPCPFSDPLCIQEVNQEYIYAIVEEDRQSGPNEEANQGYHDYIEHWF